MYYTANRAINSLFALYQNSSDMFLVSLHVFTMSHSMYSFITRHKKMHFLFE